MGWFRAIHEQEQTLAAFKCPARLDEIGDALRRTSDSKDTEARETETTAVDILPPCHFVGDEFSVKGRLA